MTPESAKRTRSSTRRNPAPSGGQSTPHEPALHSKRVKTEAPSDSELPVLNGEPEFDRAMDYIVSQKHVQLKKAEPDPHPLSTDPILLAGLWFGVHFETEGEQAAIFSGIDKTEPNYLFNIALHDRLLANKRQEMGYVRDWEKCEAKLAEWRENHTNPWQRWYRKNMAGLKPDVLRKGFMYGKEVSSALFSEEEEVMPQRLFDALVSKQMPGVGVYTASLATWRAIMLGQVKYDPDFAPTCGTVSEFLTRMDLTADPEGMRVLIRVVNKELFKRLNNGLPGKRDGVRVYTNAVKSEFPDAKMAQLLPLLPVEVNCLVFHFQAYEQDMKKAGKRLHGVKVEVKDELVKEEKIKVESVKKEEVKEESVKEEYESE
ncbi:hypothetical protein HDU98_009640 [Podochytrium sp. JEL0797]|nr:hypothetical protein HDU98_009640 [Podochytrium sp. JEL0797]